MLFQNLKNIRFYNTHYIVMDDMLVTDYVKGKLRYLGEL